MKPIYLDYAATPVDPRVAAIIRCLTHEGVFGNPASLHAYGQQARQAAESAREDCCLICKSQRNHLDIGLLNQ